MERGIASESLRVLLRHARFASSASFAAQVEGGVDLNVEGKISWNSVSSTAFLRISTKLGNISFVSVPASFVDPEVRDRCRGQ
jgi:hypothetical protein